MLRRAPKLWKPHKYQKKAVRFLVLHGAGALWLSPGLGKTSIVLYAFRALLQAKIARKTLVVAPLRVAYSVWGREAAKWKQFKNLKVVVLHGPKKEELLNKEADIYCINYEGLPWLCERGRYKKLKADTLVLDESTKIKHTNTRRFGMLKQILPSFNRRWELTGTPAPNGLMDVFGQVYALDLGASLGPYITHFRQKYFDEVGYDWILKKGSEKKIYRKLRDLVLRMDARDYLDLPEVVINDIKITLPPKAMRIYREMEDKLITLLDDGTKLTAASTGVAAGKCLQISNGGIYVRDDFGNRSVKELHTEKIEALSDLLEEIGGEQVLILYLFGHDKTRIQKLLPKAECVADLSTKKADAMFERWNYGKVQHILAQPQSIGHGLNLQGGGQHMIWYGVPWDLEIILQTIDRLCRQGSRHKSIFVHRLISENTIDEDVCDLVAEKDANQRSLLNAMKRRRRTKLHKINK